MINYLEKFNSLPNSIKEAISSEEAMSAITEIENKYDINLATIVMRVAVKDISIVDLSKFFVFEHEMDGKKADDIVSELKEKVFYLVANYLGFESNKRAPSALERQIKTEINDDVKKVASSNFFFSSEDEEEVSKLAKKVNGFVSKEEQIKQKEKLTKEMDQKLNIILNQLTIKFSSVDMTNRFKYVISSYLRGIRNRIDTREVFKKSIENGGLELDDILVDRILAIVDKVNKEDIEIKDIPKPLAKMKVAEDPPTPKASEGRPSDTVVESMASEGKSTEDNKISETAPVGGDKDILVNGKKHDNKKENKNKLKLSGVRDLEYDFSKFSKENKVKKENKDTNKEDKVDKELDEKLKVMADNPIDITGLSNEEAKEEKNKSGETVIDLSSREKLDGIIQLSK